MSLNSLLESANPYKSLQNDAARLANKWGQTGLLEGLNGAHKNNMGMILENQAKQLVVENNSTSGTLRASDAQTGDNWAGVALPLVRKVFGQIAAQEFVSVQPMNMPAGLIFFLDFQYGNDKSGFNEGGSMYGDIKGFADQDVDEYGNPKGGYFGAGRFGYSINSKTITPAGGITELVAVNSATASDVNYDTRIDASALSVVTVDVADLDSPDLEAIRSFQLVGETVLSQFTKLNAAEDKIVFVIKGSVSGTEVEYSVQPTDATRGDYEDSKQTTDHTLQGSAAGKIAIPEINIGMKSTSITAKTRKLKAVWTPEFAQDMNAYQNIDAEAEITSILSEHISMEIDLEILDMLMESANGGVERWSAKNNNFASSDNNTGFTQASVNSGGFYNTQGQWFQTLGTKIQKISNQIHQKTLRGGANFIVCAPAVSTILESIPGFSTDHNGDVEKAQYAFGVEKSGSISGGKVKIYKNPYMTDNTMLLGYRGTQFLETGAVFAPYIPLIMTPMIYDPETFTPRKGLLTRYAKKMVRPEFYGKIFIEGLGTL